MENSYKYSTECRQGNKILLKTYNVFGELRAVAVESKMTFSKYVEKMQGKGSKMVGNVIRGGNDQLSTESQDYYILFYNRLHYPEDRSNFIPAFFVKDGTTPDLEIPHKLDIGSLVDKNATEDCLKGDNYHLYFGLIGDSLFLVVHDNGKRFVQSAYQGIISQALSELSQPSFYQELIEQAKWTGEALTGALPGVIPTVWAGCWGDVGGFLSGGYNIAGGTTDPEVLLELLSAGLGMAAGSFGGSLPAKLLVNLMKDVYSKADYYLYYIAPFCTEGTGGEPEALPEVRKEQFLAKTPFGELYKEMSGTEVDVNKYLFTEKNRELLSAFHIPACLVPIPGQRVTANFIQSGYMPIIYTIANSDPKQGPPANYMPYMVLCPMPTPKPDIKKGYGLWPHPKKINIRNILLAEGTKYEPNPEKPFDSALQLYFCVVDCKLYGDTFDSNTGTWVKYPLFLFCKPGEEVKISIAMIQVCASEILMKQPEMKDFTLYDTNCAHHQIAEKDESLGKDGNFALFRYIGNGIGSTPGENGLDPKVVYDMLKKREVGKLPVGFQKNKLITSTGPIGLNISELPPPDESKKDYKGIPMGVFEQCDNLQLAHFPLIKKIPKFAFANCNKLKIVVTPSATEIGIQSFVNCKSLAYLFFSSVNKIDPSSFQGCTNLKEICFPKMKKQDFVDTPKLIPEGVTVYVSKALSGEGAEETVNIKFPPQVKEGGKDVDNWMAKRKQYGNHYQSETDVGLSDRIRRWLGWSYTKTKVLEDMDDLAGGAANIAHQMNIELPMIERQDLQFTTPNPPQTAIGNSTRTAYKPRTVASCRQTKKEEQSWSDKHMQEKWDNRESDDIEMFIDDRNKNKKDDDLYEV